MTESIAQVALRKDQFSHISEKFRGKVAADLLTHLTSAGQWDFKKFNPHNDYQRHLYALFLKVAGVAKATIWAGIFALSDDVAINHRQQYVDDVLHSEIVGFIRVDGSLLAIPDQEIAGAGKSAEE